MISGVIAFTFASGSLATILQSIDNQNAEYKKQLNVLNRVFKEHSIPLSLYSRLKQSLNHHQNKDLEDTHHFLQNLPHKLKMELSAYIYSSTYENLYFL